MARAVASSGAISFVASTIVLPVTRMLSSGHALATQVPDGLLGGRAVQVGQDADDAPVQFLGHGIGVLACVQETRVVS